MTTRTSTVFRDPIVEEIREIKRRLAEKFDYNVSAMLKDAQKRQARSGRKIITLSGQGLVAAESRRATAQTRRRS